MSAPARRGFWVHPDCFRVSYVCASATRFFPEEFVGQKAAIAVAKELVAGKAKVALVYAVFGERLIEVQRFKRERS